ncbi:uncharacterized protein DS421_8g243800 [Arachis hypogaea]|nr:uncharacterized protein DS421_8g243800 [Arachis hypogaea]
MSTTLHADMTEWCLRSYVPRGICWDIRPSRLGHISDEQNSSMVLTWWSGSMTGRWSQL